VVTGAILYQPEPLSTL